MFFPQKFGQKNMHYIQQNTVLNATELVKNGYNGKSYILPHKKTPSPKRAMSYTDFKKTKQSKDIYRNKKLNTRRNHLKRRPGDKERVGVVRSFSVSSQTQYWPTFKSMYIYYFDKKMQI